MFHPSEFAQCDFFVELSQTCESHEKLFNQALNHSYFLSPDIPKAQKLKTIAVIESDLKKQQASLRELKEKLKAQDVAEDKQVETSSTK